MPARTRTIIKHDLFKAWNRNSFGVCMHQSICLYSAWFASTFNFQALIFSRNSKWLFWQAYAANVEDQNQIKSARSSVFSSTWLHGYLHSAPWSRGITLLDSAIILISSLDSKMILRYLKYVLTLSDLIPYSPSVCRSGSGPMEDMNYSSSYERISWRPVPTTSSWGGEKTWISWTADRTQDPLPKRGSVNEHVLMIRQWYFTIFCE